ncbi:unnamed protein product [Rotaria sordida]|uniref:RNA-binding protein NOB1 n=1 Tax=Rotaria sordida TaxID=392033 RepID=A0A813QQA0_9BILA|nr:unnamed protein product [Rotaria sordida]
MVEHNSDGLFSCKLCPEETKKSFCIANCIGCKDLFCFVHLIQHRQELSNEFDELIKQHQATNEISMSKLKINEHLEYIDKWEYEIIELIHQHTKDVKEKILCIFNVYKSELKRRHTNLGKELNDKRNLNAFIESDLKELSRQMEQLDKDIQNINKVLNQVSINELNQIVNKYNQSVNTIEKSIKWNYLRDIKLDSTYGYMAANDQQIFLGWKNRIVIYNIDGTKHDETRLQSVETYGELCDLIYSSTMECFFILCRKSLFVHHPLSNQIELLPYITLINHNNHYISITTNNNKLLLLNEESLDVWRLNNKIFLLDYSILIKLIIKNQLDENICCIRTNEQNLAILIQNNKTHTWRLDLFNIYPFQCIHMGTSFDYFNQPNLGLFMPLDNKIYLFMNWETKLMRMIDSNSLNQIIDYNAFNACLLGTQHKLIMSTTNNNNKRVNHLVVDSSAFIRQAPLHNLTDVVYTVEDVVNEIRDIKTRESLNVVLYTLKFKEPSVDAIRFVTNYAKKTGDYAFLSAVDLRLLALTYQLYQEIVGTENLNLEPKINTTIPNSSVSFGNAGVKLAGFIFPKNEEKNDDQNSDKPTTENQIEKEDEIIENNNEEEEEDNDDDDVQSFVTAVENENDITESINDLHLGHDDDGWITPSNIKTVKSKALDNGTSENSETIQETLPVACITTDFSMQNVLIQMGIPVLSVDGLLIRTARSYVLKCRVCPGVTRQMTKQFCPECGNPSLQRASVSIDSSGQRHYYLTGRYRQKPRQSLPLPRGGKHSNNPIRVEGQPRPQNRPTKKSLMKRNVLDDDYLAGSSPFGVHDIYSRAATLDRLSEQCPILISQRSICKWSHCLCLKRHNDNDDQNEVLSSIIQQNTSTSDSNLRRYYQNDPYHVHPSQPQPQQQWSSFYHNHPSNVHQHISNARDDFISPLQSGNNRYRLNDIKVPRVTITTLPIQPSQQRVPCLSMSPQISGSSITRSTNSLR